MTLNQYQLQGHRDLPRLLRNLTVAVQKHQRTGQLPKDLMFLLRRGCRQLILMLLLRRGCRQRTTENP